MCTGSIHVPHRLAKATERLVVQRIPDMGALKGYYPYEAAGDGKLVCIRSTTEAVIKLVRFEEGMAPKMMKWEGKRNVKVKLRFVPYADQVTFVDGSVAMLNSLKDGVRVDIGIPVKPRKPKGMKVVEGALREALALPPEPKPEDAPAEQPAEPAKEPAPAGDAPANTVTVRKHLRRRR